MEKARCSPLGEKTAARRARDAFSLEELSKIFRTPPYSDQPEKRGVRYWAALIGLFTGMRQNEICQLNIGDIKKSTSGIWFIHVIDDDETKNVKNDRSRREVPVHSELIKLGLVNFVERERQLRASGKLFEGVRKTEVRNYGARLSRWFNETFLVQAKVKSSKNGFHSLRHTFKDALTRAEIYQDVIDALGGWNTIRSGSSAIYGNGPSVDQLASHIEKVSYPGLDLSHLYDPQVH